jgi:hypothetical protein
MRNPFKLNTSGDTAYQASSWDVLGLNGLPVPGLVIAAIPVMEVEYTEIAKVTVEKDLKDIPSAGTSILGEMFPQRYIEETYTKATNKKPKTIDFTLLIINERDFDEFTYAAKWLQQNMGAKWRISHPQAEIWGFKEVFITNISTGFPDLVNGWEVTISFTEYNDKPKAIRIEEGWSAKYQFELGVREAQKQAKEKKNAAGKNAPKNNNGGPPVNKQGLNK